MLTGTRTLQPHLREFKEQGYTVFPGFMEGDRVAELRALLDPLFKVLFADNPDASRRKIHPLLGHAVLGPACKDLAIDPTVLDFAELAMGPFLQADSFEVSGFPAREAARRGEPELWHRDHFHVAGMYADVAPADARKPYTPPLACNCLIYLQEMNEETGYFQMIPGSHLDYTVIESDKQRERHPRQRPISLGAGDMVILHHDVLHTGCLNTAHETRYFVSNYIGRFGLPHRDSFDLPIVHELIAEARERNDRRTLRFFGEDDDLLSRQEETWRSMAAEDRRALIKA